MKTQISIAGFLLAFAVALGAFGAHALEGILSAERMQTWETAVLYHTWNSLGVIIVGLISKAYEIRLRRVADLLLLGIFIFAGSLYTLCLTDIGWFGAITPVGGLFMIIAWIDFGILLVRNSSNNT